MHLSHVELLDLPHACRAVIQQAREEDANHPRTVGECRSAEQGIDARVERVLFGTRQDTDAAPLDQQIVVARSQLDMPGLDRLTVDRP